jgi:hypothetical protein
MKKIKSGNDIVFIQENFLSSKECDRYLKQIPDIGYCEKNLPWDQRIIDISTDPIVKKTIFFLKTRFNIKLNLHTAQLQNHHTNSFSDLHVHNNNNCETTKFNSLIYLNDDFDGGEFFTKNGIIIKPKKGMLTFFNGQTTYHGVKKVCLRDRKTIILWWKR